MTQQETYKRWYDHDPLLLEVVDLLKNFQDELRSQAEIFVNKIEDQVGKDVLESYYATVKPYAGGTRWYDNDPLLSKAIELLRVVPPDVQKKAAKNFLEAMEQQGITAESIKATQ